MTLCCMGRALNHWTIHCNTNNTFIFRNLINTENTILAFLHELDTAYRVHVEKLDLLI